MKSVHSSKLEKSFKPLSTKKASSKDTVSKNCISQQFAKAHNFCFSQKELDAAKIAAKFAFESEFKDIHNILATYFATREAIAVRFHKNDPDGAKWSNFYRSHPQFVAKNKVSAVLIVKNEARHIERCLKSIQNIADEIVVVDTGSSDNTMEVAHSLSLTNLVTGTFEWINDFSAARNYALGLASGDWCFWIDADEEFDPAGFAMLFEGVMRPHFGGFVVQIKNFTEDEGDESQFYHQNVRLFRNLPSIKFENRIHEMVTSSIERSGYLKANLDKVTLIHHGYRPSEAARKNKYETYLAMLEKEVTEDPENGFQWFNLSNIYYTFNRFVDQEYAGKKALQFLPHDIDVLSFVYELVAGAQTKLGRPLDALETVAQAKAAGIENLLLSFEKAAAYFAIPDYAKALEASDECVHQIWPQGLIGDYSVFAYKRWTQRAQILNCLTKYPEAETAARTALNANEGYPYSHYHLAVALEGQRQLKEALEHFSKALSAENLKQWTLTGIGRIEVELGNFEAGAKAFQAAWQIDQSDYRIWSMWADACEKIGGLDQIIQSYESLIKSGNATSDALINFGRALDRAGDQTRALDCFVEAIQKSPNNSNAYFNCGDILYRMEEFHDAAHIYQLGLRIDPEAVEGWFVLGNSLAMMGLNDGARTAYNQVLEKNPEHQGATHNLEVLAA